MQAEDPGPLAEQCTRVLLAEDDEIARKILQHWLEAWGYEVVLARDGDEAWQILEQPGSPNLVILDWVMPGIDGIELCRRLREQPEYYKYILMITGRGDANHVIHALESGADDCVIKPFVELELRARMVVAGRILALQDELIQTREEIREQAMKDSLTGLWNRAAFKELFEQELDRAVRVRGQTGLLLLDLDHFKRINDAFGHMTGDVVLRKAARILRQNVRAYDFVGRFGGEEFFIAFPNCTEEQIRAHAERVRLAIANNPVRVGNLEIPITFSIGAAVTSPTDRTMAGVMSMADVALYRAKATGRNRCVHCRKPALQILEFQGSPRSCCATCEGTLSAGCSVHVAG